MRQPCTASPTLIEHVKIEETRWKEFFESNEFILRPEP
jgi:hypothetical protein